VFLPLAAIRKFKSVGTNIALIVGLLLIAVVCYLVVELQSNYYNEVAATIDVQDSDRSQNLTRIKQGLNVGRGILAAFALTTMILIYRTVKIWKESHSRPQL
jgi:hypothetical protein